MPTVAQPPMIPLVSVGAAVKTIRGAEVGEATKPPCT